MSDARFEDAFDAPLRLVARDPADLQVIAALVQDAVFPLSEVQYDRRSRRFAVLLNRFRWESRSGAALPPERVRSVLVFEDVLRARVQGVDLRARDTVLSLLSMDFSDTGDGTGTVQLILAGDGAIALHVECIEALLRDVTRPYAAPSGKAPSHPDDESDTR